MIHYIAIHGPKRVGKDMFAISLADVIRKYGDLCWIDRLADPLYRWAEEVTGMTYKDLMSASKDSVYAGKNEHLHGRTPRSLLIDLGLFARNTYGDTFLTHCLRMRARRFVKWNETLSGKKEESTNTFVLIPDVRTETEAVMTNLVFDLSRDGIVYEGNVLEHAFESIHGVPVVPIHLANTTNYSEACNFEEIYHNHLKPLKKQGS